MNLYVQESGPSAAPTIVFLHGNGANGTMWQAHLAALSDCFHCLAPDFPGFGRSGAQEWVSLADSADRIAALISAHGGRAHLVGLSLGGSTAMTLLSRYPDLIDHAIVDGAGLLPVAGLAGMRLGFPLMRPFLHQEWLIRLIANGMKIPAEEYAAFRLGMRQMSPRSFVRAFLEALALRAAPGLTDFPRPVLFVAGAKEPEAVRRSQAQLAGAMAQAAVRVAPGMGHGWLAEAPELHVRMVRAWLEDGPLPTELAPGPR